MMKAQRNFRKEMGFTLPPGANGRPRFACFDFCDGVLRGEIVERRPDGSIQVIAWGERKTPLRTNPRA